MGKSQVCLVGELLAAAFREDRLCLERSYQVVVLGRGEFFEFLHRQQNP